MKCSFCSFVFDAGGARQQCQGCLLAGTGCRSVRCPRCGYEMPEEIGIAQRFREWKDKVRRSRIGRKACAAATPAREFSVDALRPPMSLSTDDVSSIIPAIPTMSLAAMAPGQSGVVVDLRSEKQGQVQKCLALGIVPGVSLTLRRRSPCFIFDMGFSQFAIDESMAGAIVVQARTGGVELAASAQRQQTPG